MHGLSTTNAQVVAVDDGHDLTVVSNGSHAESLERKSTIKKVKAKVKDVLHIHSSGPERTVQESSEEHEQSNIFDDPAFDPEAALGPPESEDGTKDEGKRESTLDVAARVVSHPRQFMRNRATKKTASMVAGQKPATLDHDKQLLEAHDMLDQAKSRASARGVDTEDELDVQAAREKVDHLEDQRHSLRSAWVLGRHVVRVRVVHPPLVQWPRAEEFVTRNPQTRQEEFAWGKRLAYIGLWYCQGFTARYIDDFENPPFDLYDFAREFERFVVGTEAWQAWLLDVRRVYRWDDPWRTFRWGCLFWTLWYTEHIVAYLYFEIIYSTLRNRFWASNAEDVRASVQRALDTDARAQAWTDLLQKHGNNDWVEPLMDEVGPIIQMYLHDATDFLEILTNFYRWERPEKTWGTITFFAVALSITLLTDMAFCVKLVWFILGGAFFFIMPIRSRLKQYRMAVNVMRWIWWDHPTQAELAIIELQEKSIKRDAEYLKAHEPSPLSDIEEEYDTKQISVKSAAPYVHQECYTFRAYQALHAGRLKIDRFGLEFTQASNTTVFEYSDILEMVKPDLESKRDKATSLLHGEVGGLRFILNDGESIDLTLRKSDQMKVFNLVLGWSALKWQVLQPQRTLAAGDGSTSKSNRATLDRSIARIIPG